MASYESGADTLSDQRVVERIPAYWKKAAEAYHQACASETEERRAMYFRLAMSWAAMASGLEHLHGVAQESRAEIRTAH